MSDRVTGTGTLEGRILTPDGLVRGRLHFGGQVTALEPADVDGPLLLPGFIDAHVHGGGGADTMDGPEGVRTLARFHLQHGTTTLLPTTITRPWPEVLQALGGVAEVMANGDADLPDIPGAHLEGPFLSPERLGAQPPHAIIPETPLVEEAIAKGVVRVVTLAPEIDGAQAAARLFAGAGVRVSLGHTRASYETTLAASEEIIRGGGTVGFTHLFNAMGGITGRDPGVAGAALAQGRAFAELIFDRFHVADGSMHAARAAKGERLLFVTDAMRAAGMAEGESELGGHRVFVKDGRAVLEDGTLAGSVLTMDGALRNALAAGVPLPEASALLSRNAARYLGLADRGELALGLRADIVALDEDYRVEGVWVAGRRVV